MAAPEPIAIIGLSFKFPGGAETPDDLWDILLQKRCTATHHPKDRFNADAYWHPDSRKQRIIKSKVGHFISTDIKNFDAGFFSVAPDDAGAMDPQHRGFLETTYHALESAGLGIRDVAGSKTSVHVGCFNVDQALLQGKDAESMPKYNSLGTSGAMLANRISWFYDLRGESMYIDTACSSSLVALSLACRGLLSGDSDMAVVGGANIIMAPEFTVSLSNMSLLSTTGRCLSFDAKGDGYGRGEGIATLILKPVSKALADKNPIRGLIRSVGMNEDGRTDGGVTQPSKNMQVQLIKDTYRRAGLNPRHTRFFEAHGTGTVLGDSTEARAVGEAFFEHRSKDDPLYIGAVKSNLGHLEGASGLAGVIKAVLALERGVIPPNANFEKLNPRIDADFFHLKFPTESLPWPRHDDIRRVSVNSFGFGGSNAHVILEAASSYLREMGHVKPPMLTFAALKTETQHSSDRRAVSDASESLETMKLGLHVGDVRGAVELNPGELVNGTGNKDAKPRLLVLSAFDKDGIARQTESLSKYLSPASAPQWSDDEDIDDLFSTLNRRGDLFEWKSFAVLESFADFAKLQNHVSSPVQTSRAPVTRLGMVFTGQGAQWAGMGRELLKWPVFLLSLSQSQKCLDDMGCHWNLCEEISLPAEESRVNVPEYSQTMTTAIQIGLVSLLKKMRVAPDVVVGHSSGEIAAAYCAGFLDHHSSLKAAYFRGLLATELSLDPEARFGMASVGLSADQTREALQRLEHQAPGVFDATQITMSCLNSPANTTVSGPICMLDPFVTHLQSIKVFAKRLAVNVGYHSPQMDAVSSRYVECLANLRPGNQANHVKMISSVTPGFVDATTVCRGEYWALNMTSPVRFVEAMEICCTNPTREVTKTVDRSHLQQVHTDGWLEIGPHAALKGPIRELYEFHGRKDTFYGSLLVRNKSAAKTILEAAGLLLCHGVELDLNQTSQLDKGSPCVRRTVVDLPQYPFNHSVIHWHESEVSKETRSREHRRHPLLGSRLTGWNALDARWRFVIRMDEIPWISDHRVRGRIWYPAAGMVVMAVEAIKQLLGDDCIGVELRDVSFTAPLVISEDGGGSETQISMVPTTRAVGSRETDYNFRIFVKQPHNAWQQVCDGTIVPQWPQAVNRVNKTDEQNEQILGAQKTYFAAERACEHSVPDGRMYQNMARDLGIQYGPAFQRLTNIQYSRGGGEAHAGLKVIGQEVTESSQPFTIHPTALDSIFQLALVALANGLGRSESTFVPSRLTRLWIAHDGAGNARTEPESLDPISDLVHVRAKPLSKRNAVASFTVFSKTDMRTRVEVSDLELTELAKDQQIAASGGGFASMTHELRWAADLELMSQHELSEYCARHRKNTPDPEDWYIDSKMMLLGFAKQALQEMKSSGQDPTPSLRKYYLWLQEMLDDFRSSDSKASLPVDRGQDSSIPSGAALQDLSEQLAKRSQLGTVFTLVGRQLADILTGVVDPLKALFDDRQLLSGFYKESNTTGEHFPMLTAYLDVLVHKEPGLRFLEIGAGTGATTELVLGVIGDAEQGPRYAQYTFTDISNFFLGPARDKFSKYDRLSYRTLDIERHLGAQGYGEADRHDVVVAANVLHTTKELSATLSNVRSLLKPGGKLILIEMTTPGRIDAGFVWGTLEGWWNGVEDYRKQGAIVDENRWDQLLKQQGFTGAEHIFRDWGSSTCHIQSIIISSAAPLGGEQDDKHDKDVLSATDVAGLKIVIDHGQSAIQSQVALQIQAMLASRARMAGAEGPEIVSFEQLQQGEILAGSTMRDCILLADLDAVHLLDCSAEMLQFYQKILTKSTSVVWVQGRDTESSDRAPYYGIVEGTSRVVRSENPFVRLVNLTLELTANACAKKMASQIVKVFLSARACFSSSAPGDYAVESDEEYMEISGALCINRLRQAKYLDRHIHTRTQNPVRHGRLGSAVQTRLDIRTSGLLDTVEWVEDELACEPLPDNMVEIEVRAVGINFKDGLILLGRVSSSTVGLECSGVIRRVGSSIEGLEVGDRVMAVQLYSLRTHVRAEQTHVCKMPEGMSFEEAASMPVAFFVAYYSLHQVARLQENESILIHAAAGATGQAAVQLAKLTGAQVFATVGSVEKRDLLVRGFGIPEDHIFYSRDASFAEGVRRMTGGRGVDVVLNSLSGKLLVASWELMAEYGRFVEIGRKDIDMRAFLPMSPFGRNATFAGVEATTIINGTGQKHLCILDQVLRLMSAGQLRPLHPIHTFSAGQADQAVRFLISGKSAGKVVLKIQQDDVVPLREGANSNYRFSENATYVIAGGFGGIGRQIARWMGNRGARHILILARSGPEGNPKRLGMMQKLRAKGIDLQCAVCNIGDIESVRGAISRVAQTMPPIKGCFQATMDLHDRPFEAMSHTEWCSSLEPKVHGSWNLHSTLPRGMDFFVMLASVSGIFGNQGQANYAAGSCFQDALARHRVTQGEKAISIDLGVVLDKGWVAERDDLGQRLMQLQHLRPLSQPELFAMLDFCCDTRNSFLSSISSQIVTGIQVPASIIQAGRSIPDSMKRPLFRAMFQVISGHDSSATAVPEHKDLAALIHETETMAQAGEIIAEALKVKLCQILGVQEENKTIYSRMDSFGVDSLIALELRNWLVKAAGANVAAHEILGDVKLIETGLMAAERSRFRRESM